MGSLRCHLHSAVCAFPKHSQNRPLTMCRRQQQQPTDSDAQVVYICSMKCKVSMSLVVNPLIATLKPQSNGPSYSNAVIGSLLIGGLLHLVERGGAGRGCSPPRPLLAVPNVTAHPSTASVPTSYYSIRHYNCLGSLNG